MSTFRNRRQTKTLSNMNVKGGLILSLLLLLGSVAVMGQTTKGCIISIENGVVNVDLTNAQVKAGDCLNVIVSGGYMTHPVTGRRVRKEDRILCKLEVGDAYSEYSVARPHDVSSLSQLKPGMTVQISKRNVTESIQQNNTLQSNKLVSKNDIMLNNFVSDGKTTGSDVSSISIQALPESKVTSEKVSIVIAPAQVNDIVHSGHFGGYVADVLMEQMLMCDKVRLLDRSVLNAQIDEINLAGDILDPSTTIKREQGIGVRYILQTTMQKPDVANVRTGIPLASVMGAVQGLTGTNIGANYASDMKLATLKASVNLSVRVVDLQTGEIVFMCSGSGKAQGKSQLSLEYGALGGGELNGGAEDFKQTVTGKAIQQAFMKIGRNLKDFFNGRTDRKVMGSVSGEGSYGDKMYAKGYKLYLGTQRLDKDGISSAFSGYPDLYFKYRKTKSFQTWARSFAYGGLAIGGVLGIAEIIAGEGDGIFVISGAAIAGLGLVGGVTFHVIGIERMKKVVNQYNSGTGNTFSTVSQPRMDLALYGNGLGLRFTF